jgi:hypothetical protein
MSSLAPPTAQDRLDASRAALRRFIQSRTAQGGTATGAHASNAPAPWLDSLRQHPAAIIVIGALSAWWKAHPLHTAGVLAAATARSALLPVAQRHPLGLVFGALLVGGLLAWTRPWRWLPRARTLQSPLLAGLWSSLALRAASELPLQSWIAGMSAAATPDPQTPVPPAASGTPVVAPPGVGR